MLKSGVYRAEVLPSRDGRTCIKLSLLSRYLRDCTLLCDIRRKIQCKVSINGTNPPSNNSTSKVSTYFDQFGVYVVLFQCYIVGKPTV